MDRKRWKQIDDVLEQALDLEPVDRANSLSRMCAGDDELRRRVEALLERDREVEHFLETSALECLEGQNGDGFITLTPGQQIGHYTVKSRIGAGGMGEVWKARDERLNRDVAIKVLPPEFSSDPDRVRRFEQEALAASRLNHPNIITIFEIVQTGDGNFIAAEYVEGQTLRQLMESGPMAWTKALEIAVQIASALAAAHDAGVVHRDIKPENVMVRPDGLVKVLDFGLAKFTGFEVGEQGNADRSRESVIDAFAPYSRPSTWANSERLKTQPGRLMGTVGYMSPEQLSGGPVDGRSDLFSLGVVLYEIIVGCTPFAGADQSGVIKAILERKPERPASSVAPRELRRIIVRALGKEPALRYAGATQMLDDLRMVQRRLWWLKWRGRALRTAAMMLALSLIGVLVWLGLKSRESAPPIMPASITTTLADGKIYEETDVSPDGGLVAYTNFVGRNRGLWVRDLTTGSEMTLVSPASGYDCKSPTFTPDGSSLYFLARRQLQEANALYQIPVGGGPIRRILEKIDSPVAFAPDGRRFVFMREDRGLESTRARSRRQTTLYIANLDGGDARPVVSRQEPDRIFSSRAAWAPDGKRVAYAAGTSNRETPYQLYQIALESGAEMPLSSYGWKNIEDLVWLRDNSGLALIAADASDLLPHVWFLSLADGKHRLVTSDAVNYSSLSATADSRALLAIQYQFHFSLWTMPVNDSIRIRQIVTSEMAGRYGIAWTLLGQILYAAGARPQLWITDVDGRNNRSFTSDAADNAPSLSPDDRYLVYCSRREPDGSANIWQMELATRRLKRLSRGRLDVEPKCSPDGRWVVYVSWDERDKASIWKMPLAGGAAQELAAEITENPSPAISPDGRRLAYYRNEGHRKWIDIISLDDHRSLRSIEVRESFYLLEWSRDGRALIYAESTGRVSNLYQLPLAGGSPKPFTDFYSYAIVQFATSRDGAWMALSRYRHNRNLVRIADFK